MTAEAMVSSEGAGIAVIVPCWNDGDLLSQTVGSLRPGERLEIVVVDDGSTDPGTLGVLTQLETAGVRVVRQERNLGVSAARNRGLAETSAPFVFPLDADDLAIPGALRAMRAQLEADPDAAVSYGDYLEFGAHELVRAVPAELDPYRLSYTNEYPVSALFRRTALESVGGWRRFLPEIDSRQDWNLWLSLAESGATARYNGSGFLTYARRIHSGRLAHRGRDHHRGLYDALQNQHPDLFSKTAVNRRRSGLSTVKKLLYPAVYGRRSRWSGERQVKAALDRLGIWTLTGGELTPDQRAAFEAALEAGGAGIDRAGSR
jgi:glycosyltransferase involved in cell wall biosynthesis